MKTYIEPTQDRDPLAPTVGARRVWIGGRPSGWLMPRVENHVPEQPTNQWKQRLIEAQREAQS
jgi:hypothetical protein